MEEKARRRKFGMQTANLYAAIGKFVVKFELLCHVLRGGIIFMLEKSGLKIPKMADILLVDLTAGPLLSIFRAMIPETKELSNTDRQIINNICTRTIDLIEKRNFIIHSTWFVGWAMPRDADFRKTTGIKIKRTKMGRESEIVTYTATDFNKEAQKADVLYNLINQLNFCLLFPNTKIENNFKFDEDKNVILPTRKKLK